MSGEDGGQPSAEAKDNLADANRQLYDEQRAARNGQFLSMAGMMGMFIITILLGLLIRPFYDSNNLQAFGESGTTQVRFVLLELVMIFIFTAIILFLAKWKKDWIIKYGIMGIMAIALLYSTIPLAHVLLVDDLTEDFVIESNSNFDADQVATTWGENGFMTSFEDGVWNNSTNTYSLWQGDDAIEGTPSWSVSLQHYPADLGSTPNIALGEMNGDTPGYFTVTNGAHINTIDNQGVVVESFRCYEETDQGPVINQRFGSACVLAITTSDSMYIIDVDNNLHRYVKFEDTGQWGFQASWILPPELELTDGLVRAELIDEDKFWVTTQTMSIVIELEETSSGFDPLGNPVDPATLIFNQNSESNNFTSAVMGISPWATQDYANYTSPERLMLLGDDAGAVVGFNWNSTADSEFSEEERLALSGFDGITSIRFTDMTLNGYSELVITSNSKMHFLAGTSLVEYFYTDVNENSITSAYTTDDETILSFISISESELTLENGELNDYMLIVSGIYFDNTASLIGLVVAALVMILLYVHSEWYVVNTAAVLVGAGVIAMLGVTFVPSLIIIFLILAAIYDAWAVYKSKHMLDLADTMLKQRLPILLVAPQEKGYSFIEETASMKDGDTIAGEPKPVAPGKPKPKKKRKDAMFMGLGDIIFPGMLVVSAMQYFDGSDGFTIALGTLIGGLVGYVALMSFVASGRPQAGLPLLNGGAILGYIISGLVAVGTALFSFGITF